MTPEERGATKPPRVKWRTRAIAYKNAYEWQRARRREANAKIREALRLLREAAHLAGIERISKDPKDCSMPIVARKRGRGSK